MKKSVGSKIITLAWVAVVMLIGTHTLAQKGNRYFRFPAQVSSQDYDPRFVLVKLKPLYRETFRESRGPIIQNAGMAGVRQLLPEQAAFSARARKGPRRSKSSVDTGLYYRINCTPGTNIEDFINQLYGTGYFEIVEPEYVNRLTYIPNDPSVAGQYYLNSIRAFEAWNESLGNTSVTIAIVDTGGDLAHEDLAGNLATLADDPLDGIDNDGNGFIDDNRGWDFIGDNLNNLNDPNFIGDNNPQLLGPGNAAHGVSVAGCAGAVPDNAKGIAGVGFNTRLLFTKHTADNQPDGLFVYRGYEGVAYAALSGADVINLSWGGSFRSEIYQDLMNFVTEDLGVLVVAAAGNTPVEAPFYPAAYDNVLAVTAVTSTNVKASFSTIGSFVDVSAPGVGIFTTSFGSAYTSTQGTSFSSPIAAGAAALVIAKFPSYTPQQVAEQLRVTSNSALLYSANPAFVGKMGFGLLDVYAALTETSPAVRANNAMLLNESGAFAQQGETAYLTMNFKNLLESTTSALEITISETSSFLSVVKGTIRPGAIPSGGSISNALNPFEIQIASFVPDNFEVPIMISYRDGDYVDYQEIRFLLNPTYINVDENLVTTTVSNTVRIGYEDREINPPTKGEGFVFDGNSILFEMGVMMGNGSGSSLFNNVRGISQTYDQDFVSIGDRIREIIPGERSSSEIFGKVSNTSAAAAQVYHLTYRSLAWKEAPYDKFVIMEYTIKNVSANPLNDFYFGIFADWDITDNGATDEAHWDAVSKLGYVHPTAPGTGLPHAGIQLLTGAASYYAIDNGGGGGSFNIYDGFTDAEKTLSLNSGQARLNAGSGDVSHVVGAGPFSIMSGQEVKIAFALHAAPNLADLQTSAAYADTAYNYMLAAPVPVVPEGEACYGGGATLNASGASAFKWYRDFTGGTAFHTGSSFITGNLFNDTTFYVSNADESYESVRAIAKVTLNANPEILTSGSLEFCENEYLTLSVAEADSYIWSTGATTQSIQVNQPGDYSVTVATTTPSCEAFSGWLTLSTIPAPTAGFSTSGELQTLTEISFTDESVDAVEWYWDFGNGFTSTEQNPVTEYSVGEATYDITQIVAAANGCRDTLVQSISIVTGLGETADKTVRLFPNPSRNSVFVSIEDGFIGPRSVELTSLQGRIVYQATAAGSLLEIPMTDMPAGIYVVRVGSGQRLVTRKVVKIH